MYRNGSENGGFENNGLGTNEVQSVNEPAKMTISRSVYDQKDLYSAMSYKTDSKPRSTDRFDAKTCWNFFLKTFPFVSWIYTYKLEYLVGDLISGATVCSMHIPGMGHALLATLPPVVGIYMGFYPALVYGLFASSRHNSIGTFAVLAIMTEKSVSKYATIDTALPGNFSGTDSETPIDCGYTPLQIAALLCFLVGVIQLLMYIFRLGIVAFLLSDSLVSGLTTGAAFQIFSAQIKDAFGVKIPPVGAYFKIIKTYIEIFKRVDQFNYLTLAVFIVSCSLLWFNNEWLKQRVAKKTRFPVPMELIVIILSMLLSWLCDIEKNWNVFLVGDIPEGLPAPVIPKFDLWLELLTDAFAIAFVSYSVSVSLALLFAQKQNYEIDFNQELLAMGSANMAGAFFSCFPVSAALARSTLQFQLGGRTQLASVVNVLLIMCILMWIAPLFEIIPRCVLAAIIIVALKGLMMQVLNFKKFWEQSKFDALIFSATFMTVVIVAIDVGLLVGIFLSCLGLLYMSLKPDVSMLGHIPGTDLYLDVEKFEKAIEIPLVKIFHYAGSINFATKASFKSQLCSKLQINLIKELKAAQANSELVEKSGNNLSFELLIIDFTALCSIDFASVVMLNALVKDLMKLKLKVLIAGCSTKVYQTLTRNGFTFMDSIYPTVHDAVNSQI